MHSILFLSHTLRSGTFKVGSHHLSREFASQGHQVAHVSTPFSLAHRILHQDQKDRIAASLLGLHENDGVTDFVPRPLLPANMLWSRHQTRAMLRKLRMIRPDFVFVDQPLFPTDHFPGSTVVFRPTDVFTSPGMQKRAIRAVKHAQGVAATSPGVLESVTQGYDGATRVIENGVEFARFARAVGFPKKTDFIYIGALDARFDFAALASAAAVLPHATFSIYGPDSGLPQIDLPPNVNFLGPIRYEMVPEALSQARVGIMPFTAIELNAARSPMKLYEYVAAGLPILAPSFITSRVPELSCTFGYDASVRDDFAKKAAETLHLSPAPSVADTEVAARKDWSAVAAELLRFAQALTR